VEVDIPLGKIRLVDMINCHDCGKLINPQLAAGQVHGGMSMAIGFGMYEQMLYDPKTGKLLNGNLLYYKLPTMLDHPHLEAAFVENFEPSSPFGTKALGEPPTVPGAAAIRNAVLHATGVAINRIPLTPHVLFEEFKKAGVI
jgi:xanthine dehydrogenase molybdenum-binding subunit